MNERHYPVLYFRKEECCGCTACASVCPAGAIKMTVDEEGFEYPSVNQELCIKCSRCLKVCPMK